MKFNLSFLAGILLASGLSLSAQFHLPTYEDSIEVYEDLFELEEPLNLTLRFKMKTFQRTRTQEDYQPAKLTCEVNDSFRVSNPVRIKARGIYRRDNCKYPPFWLNIRYADILAEDLRDVRRIKTVIRCRNSKVYEHYVLREYLVYKIYNIISPYSFRVRLVKLKYIDTGRKNAESEDWAFLIEPNELLEKRLDAEMYKVDHFSMRTVNVRQMDLLAMFEYMIGNGDYSVTGRHNLKILSLRTAAPNGYIPIPYDFDYTGMVNTHYAAPGENLGIQSVRQRYFLGPCRSTGMHQDAIDKLDSFREEIYQLINDFQYLPEKERLDMIGYIESYFAETAKEGFIENRIASTCR